MIHKNNMAENKQGGFVSIIVTLVIMLVISLIVIGFARLTRREQRQSLDRQLSTQAYYAAETAVNDIEDALKNGITVPENTTDCSATINNTAIFPTPKNQIDATTSYSCLFVDTSPPSLEYTSIAVDSSKVIPLQDKNGGPINNVLVSWEDKGGGTNMAGCSSATPTVLPPASGWNCDTGMMRVDIVPISGSLNRDALIDGTMTVYLHPSTSGTAATNTGYGSNAGFGNQGRIIGARCNSLPGPKQCNFTFTGLGGTSYVMRLKSIYRSSSATVKAENGAGGTLELVGAQTLVDSTGKANDVLRRIQVRIPTPAFNAPFPEAAIHSVGNMCKRFGWAPPSYYLPDISTYPECDVIN